MPVLKNSRWESFVQALIAGDSQRKAYKKAFPDSTKCKDATIDNKAYALFKKDEVRARYEEIKEEAAKGAVLTRKEKREMLANMARNMELPASDRQRAIDLDNKMEDEYQHNVKLSGEINNPFAGMTTDELRQIIKDG